MGAVAKGLDDLLALLAQWDSCWLVMEIDSSLLAGGGTSITQRHWVVVDPETRPLFGRPGQSTGMTAAQLAAARRNRPPVNLMGFREAHSAAAAVRADQARARAEDDALTVRLKVVSWADEHTALHQVTLPFVLDRFYGGFAFPRFNRR